MTSGPILGALAAVIVAAFGAAGVIGAAYLTNRSKERADARSNATTDRAEDRQQFESILGGLRGMVDVQKEALHDMADRMAKLEQRADSADRRAELALTYARDLSRWAADHARVCNAEAATPPPPAPAGLDIP